MPIELVIPKVSKTMAEATVKEWLVADRSEVAIGQPVCRIVTEKAELDIDAPAAGFVRQVARAGEMYPARSVIGFVDELDDVVGVMLSAVRQFLEASELDELGIVSVGEMPQWSALVARNTSLAAHANQAPTSVSTALRFDSLPQRVLVVASTPNSAVSGIETAFALCAVGANVTLESPPNGVFAGLDDELAPLAAMVLEAVGVVLVGRNEVTHGVFDAVITAEDGVVDSGTVLIRTVPEIGWVGVTATEAAVTHDVVTLTVDLQQTPRSIVLGRRVGLLKVIADRSTGELLGVHIVNGEAREILAVSRLAMSAGLRVHDIAAMPHGPSSAVDALVAASLGLAREVAS